MLAEHGTLVLHDGNVGPVLLVPFRPRVDIADLHVKASLDEGPQLIDQHLAQMAVLATLLIQAVPTRAITVGVNCRRQFDRRNLRRAAATAIATPASAATAAPASPAPESQARPAAPRPPASGNP